MAHTSNLKIGQIVGASVPKTAQMFGVSRGTVSKVMITFKKENILSKATSLEKSCPRETV